VIGWLQFITRLRNKLFKYCALFPLPSFQDSVNCRLIYIVINCRENLKQITAPQNKISRIIYVYVLHRRICLLPGQRVKKGEKYNPTRITGRHIIACLFIGLSPDSDITIAQSLWSSKWTLTWHLSI
jgi:hypothetical protein